MDCDITFCISPYDPASCREGNTPVVCFPIATNLQPTSIEWNMLVAYWPQFWTFKAPMSTASSDVPFLRDVLFYCRNWQRIILERRLSRVSCPHVWRNFVFMLQAWSCHFVFMFFLKCHIEMRYWYWGENTKRWYFILCCISVKDLMFFWVFFWYVVLYCPFSVVKCANSPPTLRSKALNRELLPSWFPPPKPRQAVILASKTKWFLMKVCVCVCVCFSLGPLYYV